MEESYERWSDPPAPTQPLESVSLATFGNGLAVLLVATSFGFVKITFQSTIAVAAHDETTHPLIDRNAALPQLPTRGAYPYLKVVNSAWAGSLSDIRREFNEEPPTHYLVITYNNYVDVLSYVEPEIEQLGEGAWEHMFGNVAP
ncbi:hypothetical protein [Dokdonella sp.]|uniref:hypothetical protein n=1 Tax=Dokdonella sp. TaxID=2291710 RepID=UPI0031CBC505|nr:hypothetical protein [Dokdonella sp.]